MTLTLLFIVLACNAVSAAEISDNSTLQTQYQAVNQSNNNSSVDNSTNISDQPSTVVISGEVKKCSNGDPFPGVTVTVSKDGNELASTTTNENGTYYLSFLSNTSIFNVTASYPGHESASKEVTVTPGQNNNSYGTSDLQLGQNDVYVSTTGNDGNAGSSWSKAYKTIGKAISEVNSGGTIHLDSGTYIYYANGQIIKKSITFISLYMAASDVTIDGQNHRIFDIDNTGNTNEITITLWGLTVVNGAPGMYVTESSYYPAIHLNVKFCEFKNNNLAIDTSAHTYVYYTTFSNNPGGALYNQAGTLNVDKSKFNNNAGTGGGIHNTGSEATVTNSQFNGNTGGAIFNENFLGLNGVINLNNCTFTGNTATTGSAINNQGICTVTGCTFTGNNATGANFSPGGGGISNTGTLTVTGSNFTGNNASYDGSAIWNKGRSTVNTCTFTTNHAESGAIWNAGEGTSTVNGCTFTGNTASAGGAIENYGNMTVGGSTFTGNNATGLGGAISNYGKELTVSGCNFTGNTANYGGAISNAYDANYGYHGPFTVTSSIFTGNNATTGSVIYNGRDTEDYDVHFNRIYGNTGNYDVYSAGGTINAENNWWGTNFEGTNPIAAGRVNSNVDADPWIVLRLSASPNLIGLGGTSIVTADLSHNSNGTSLSGTLPNGTVQFSSNSGTFNPKEEAIGCENVTTKFTANNVPYTAQISAKLDGFSVVIPVEVKVRTSLECYGAAGYKGDNTTLTAILWMTNKPGNNAIVNFYVNGVYVGGATTDNMGIATYTYNITQNVGTYTINATFNATTQYTSSNGTNTLTVNATPTSLTVNGTSGYKGDNTTLTATLWDTAHNKTVAGEKVDFYINGAYAGQGTTDANGIATCTYNITQDVGTYTDTITANFNTTTQYTSSNGANTLTVNVIPTSLTVNGTSGYKGDNTTLTATLWDTAHNKTVVGEKVDFYIDGVYVGCGITNNLGITTCNYNITQNVGTYTINTTFNATTQYTSSNGANTLTVNATPTSLTVGAASGFKGDNTSLTVILWDTFHNRAVVGETLDFYVNGDYVGQGTTDSNGLATCNYSIAQNVGTYTINTTFNATTQYAATNGANTLTVNATPTNLTIDNVTGNKGINVTLKATITDTAHNLPIIGKSVTFKVNGAVVGNATTDINGVATLPYSIDFVGGNYTIDAVFDADNQYAASNGTGTLKVPQSSVYVVVTSSKKDPKIGETFTLTYKLGNNGPDPAENVTITIPLPEGFGISNINGDGNWTYNETTRTINWTFTELKVGDPNLYITGKLGEAGVYLFSSSITSDTYNVNKKDVTPITINAASNTNTNNTTDTKTQVNAVSNTITMQNTGIPVNYLVLAILAIISGFIVPKRK